ncbi:phosphocarrier protein FPr [Malonomonas rubra DSM 5091]|uniref:phosphoenolpyruvate--protein phosphotransferase n=1 Tax=Malonomonas rubra DSM 5091 TaxID=1122189 RepID=A0A1M6IPN9_MALRU|nr:phosphoenolpyruvate--protein phosphotransferase [Malonomonas rubra]SHJ36387.1 phosphocarrier protein FPr [Malonomonas rubra DSM 5091]
MLNLDKELIVLGAQVAGKKEAIELVGDVLVRNGYIDAAYVASMNAREAVANTFLGNGIAIPHGLPEDRELIKKTGVAVLQIPQGVAWNPGETVCLVVGIAAKSDEHITILTNLTHVLDDPDTISRLSQTLDPQDIINVLSGSVGGISKAAPEMDLTGFESVEVAITGEHGLHARPATFFVDVASEFSADVYVEFDGRTGNGKSLASLLKLGVTAGQKVRLHAKGKDGKSALAALKDAVDAGLGEESEEKMEASQLEHCWEPKSVGRIIPGFKASPGLATGPIRQFVHERIIVEANAKDPAHEKSSLSQAIAAAKVNLQNLYDEVRAKAGAGKAAIFRAHIAFLDDPELRAEVEQLINAGKSAGFAWRQMIEERVHALEQHNDSLLAARAMDLRDVGRRVLKHLAGTISDEPFVPTEPVILVAEDLTPSDTANLDPALILGLCTAGGGPTSHSAIIARSLGIPAIVAAGPSVQEIADGTIAIIDGDAGNLYLDPSREDQDSAELARTALDEMRNQEFNHRFKPAITLDDHRVEVVANIGKSEEAEQAVNAGAEGIGLLRTEFLFLGRETPPDEEEQYQHYSDMLESLNGLPLIIRTLDIGGDKEVSYLDLPAEDNPFLGERGIRLCLNRPELFLTQLRAIYRASKQGLVRIMLPMVTTLEELAAAKRLAEKARIEVGAEPVEIGIMVEVPSVAVMADVFAKEVDFFSVGTNDLTQYVMAIDRLHPTLAAQADSLHPSVLKMIDMVVRAADEAGIWVGVCGGLAGEPLGAVLLAGLGVHELSMVIPSVAAIKAQLRNIKIEDARKLAQQALKCSSVKQVRKLSF